MACHRTRRRRAALQQAGFFKARLWAGVIAAILYALAALVAVLGPVELTRGAEENRDVRRSVRIYLIASLFLMGAGTGVVVMTLLRSAMQ